jgi:hypothetical protein
MTTLDELRRANLQEQRRAAETTIPVATPLAAATPDPTGTPEGAGTLSGGETPAAAGHAALRGNGTATASTASGRRATAATETSTAPEDDEDDPVTRKARAMYDRFHRSIARKVVHPTGVRATIDMPPELFWRVKRYCHDHNNLTVRQLFLDLTMALLDEEGY